MMMRHSSAILATSALLLTQLDTGSALFLNFDCNTTPASENDPDGLSYGPTCAQLETAYPGIDDFAPLQDDRILCPFLRMMERSGAVDLNEEGATSIAAVTGSAAALGCGADACGPVAGAVSAFQQGKSPADLNPTVDLVDFLRLHDASPVSHDCGLTFSLGATEVEDSVRLWTILRLYDLADRSGRLSYFDLLTVKNEACQRDFEIMASNPDIPVKNAVDEENRTLIPGSTDVLEMALIFGYLGGVENGYVQIGDVYRFLNARLPEQKTKFLFDTPLSEAILTLPEPPCVRAGFFGISGGNTLESRLRAFSAESCQSACRDRPECNAWTFRNFWHPTDPFTCRLGTVANSRFTDDAAHIGCNARDCRVCEDDNDINELSDAARGEFGIELEVRGAAAAPSENISADSSTSGGLFGLGGVETAAIGAAAGAGAVLLVVGAVVLCKRKKGDEQSAKNTTSDEEAAGTAACTKADAATANGNDDDLESGVVYTPSESSAEDAASESGVEDVASESGVKDTVSESGAEDAASKSGAEDAASKSGAEDAASEPSGEGTASKSGGEDSASQD